MDLEVVDHDREGDVVSTEVVLDSIQAGIRHMDVHRQFSVDWMEPEV